MHIHILGICGTFMGGIATLAKALGYKVTGSDANVYPPMSTMLASQGIELIQGYDPSQLEPRPDLVVIGNAMSRGNPCVEFTLNEKIPYISGPQWLQEHLLNQHHVLAVSGTHGKTTTASMLTWILEVAGLTPSFLVGGVLGNFNASARLGKGKCFVVEADEYDSAFFDKRSKFVHYRPDTLILNNLEFDHADIFDDLEAIQRQFHHLIRTVPSNGKIIFPLQDLAINQVLAQGCWSSTESTGAHGHWLAKKITKEGSVFDVYFCGEKQGQVEWALIGEHNIDNALMAIAAANHVGVAPDKACEALGTFINTKRRLELIAEVNDIKIYDDFAHHPTAIERTLSALRNKVGTERIIAVLEPRSATMKQGVHKDSLPKALAGADLLFLYQSNELNWSLDDIAQAANTQADSTAATVAYSIDDLVDALLKEAQPQDHILIMSNGGFEGLHQKFTDLLKSTNSDMTKNA